MGYRPKRLVIKALGKAGGFFLSECYDNAILRRRRIMPYVNVQVVGKLSKEKKQSIASDISNSLLKHAGKPKDHTYIVFEEVAGENWAKGETLFG